VGGAGGVREEATGCTFVVWEDVIYGAMTSFGMVNILRPMKRTALRDWSEI
jgi:hypothetical protein